MLEILLTALLAADAPKADASGQAPRIITASIKGDRLVSKEKAYFAVPVTVQEKVLVNGREEVRTLTKYVTEVRELETAWDLKKGTATAGGKKLSLDDLKKRLSKPALVIISVDGKPISASYLKLFAADTIVIVAPMAGPATPDKNVPKVKIKPTPVPLPKPNKE